MTHRDVDSGVAQQLLHLFIPPGSSALWVLMEEMTAGLNLLSIDADHKVEMGVAFLEHGSHFLVRPPCELWFLVEFYGRH